MEITNYSSDSQVTEFGSDLTYIGLNKFARAGVTGQKVSITTVAFGDNNGQEDYKPNKDATKLNNEVWRGNISRYEITRENPTLIKVQGSIPADVGGFWIREFGFFDEDGDLIAVGNTPTMHKVYDGTGASISFSFTLYVQFETNVTDQLVIKVVPEKVNEVESRVDRLEHDTFFEMSKSDVEKLLGFKIDMGDTDNPDIPNVDGDCSCGDDCTCGDEYIEISEETIDSWFKK